MRLQHAWWWHAKRMKSWRTRGRSWRCARACVRARPPARPPARTCRVCYTIYIRLRAVRWLSRPMQRVDGTSMHSAPFRAKTLSPSPTCTAHYLTSAHNPACIHTPCPQQPAQPQARLACSVHMRARGFGQCPPPLYPLHPCLAAPMELTCLCLPLHLHLRHPRPAHPCRQRTPSASACLPAHPPVRRAGRADGAAAAVPGAAAPRQPSR